MLKLWSAFLGNGKSNQTYTTLNFPYVLYMISENRQIRNGLNTFTVIFFYYLKCIIKVIFLCNEISFAHQYVYLAHNKTRNENFLDLIFVK